jgi:hypothetical protein
VVAGTPAEAVRRQARMQLTAGVVVPPIQEPGNGSDGIGRRVTTHFSDRLLAPKTEAVDAYSLEVISVIGDRNCY